jgi:hypothetical protein
MDPLYKKRNLPHLPQIPLLKLLSGLPYYLMLSSFLATTTR